MLVISKYDYVEYVDKTLVPVCWSLMEPYWIRAFFLGTISAFFFLPLAALTVLYCIIAKHLMANPGIASTANHSAALRYRRQVVSMLGTVVLTFFVCLLPYRAFTVWVILAPEEFHPYTLYGYESYYNVLSFCRYMIYLNSAINPILYNLMSSKFREGFRRLCGGVKGCGGGGGGDRPKKRRPTVTTTSATTALTGGGNSSSQKSASGTPPNSANDVLRKSGKTFLRVISTRECDIEGEAFANGSTMDIAIKIRETYV